MADHDWESHYRAGDLPWEAGDPEPQLVELVRARGLAGGKALDVGCGIGTNSVWLAEQGFDVVGVDVAPTAIRQAESKAAAMPAVRFIHLDFLEQPVPGGPYALVFDRGCFHVFDAARDRARFAERVARVLAPDGFWVSLIGSTEGPPRDHGPPRRTARDIVDAIEPVLAIAELRATGFDAEGPLPLQAWLCVARHRQVPAQPSTV